LKTERTTGRRKANARCVICGGKKIEHNHVGGRNHVGWFTMPFCRKHHAQFHALLSNAGINLEYTSDPKERIVHALGACWVVEWVLVKKLQELISQSEKKNR
jgi:hypothetical protein